METTLFILGAYGGTGKALCKALLKFTSCNLVIAGRSQEKLAALEKDLLKEFDPKRIRKTVADASDEKGLAQALHGSQMLIVASSTADFIEHTSQAALTAGVDYLDYHFQQNAFEKLQKKETSIKEHKRVFITQAGFHPGLPATFARFGKPYFKKYTKALLGMAMAAHIESLDSVYELVDEMQDPHSELFKDGKWKEGTYKDMLDFTFSNFGKQKCYPIKMIELHPLPKELGITDTGVYVAGFNWFLDNFVVPLAFIVGKIKKGLGRETFAKLTRWGFNNVTPHGQGVSFVLEAEGEGDKGETKHLRVEAFHEDGYYFTIIPVVACLRQYLAGSFKNPGLHMMGMLVDPKKLLEDMEAMGIKIEITVS